MRNREELIIIILKFHHWRYTAILLKTFFQTKSLKYWLTKKNSCILKARPGAKLTIFMNFLIQSSILHLNVFLLTMAITIIPPEVTTFFKFKLLEKIRWEMNVEVYLILLTLLVLNVDRQPQHRCQSPLLDQKLA